MDDRTQSAATCHRPVELQVATEALNANLMQIFSGRWYTRREAKPTAKPPIQPAKQPQSSKHNTHASNIHKPNNLIRLSSNSRRFSQNYVPLPSKQRAAKLRSIHFR